MDARVTKQRLSNMLSYDWIKIIVVIAVAVTALTVFFTMVRTRPNENQIFAAYGYTDLNEGSEAPSFAESLSKGVFSYDVLEVESETFSTGGYYGDTTYTARRAAHQGTVMFTTTRSTQNEQFPEETYLIRSMMVGMALDLNVYLTDCENYLIRFFGENWQSGPLKTSEAEKCFLNRNGKDKRYRSAEKRAEGIEDEAARLEKLRTDFLFLQECLNDGRLFLVNVSVNDEEHAYAFGLGNLKTLADLYYYTVESESGTSRETEEICLYLFRNDEDEGRDASKVVNDLRYEPVSFLRYLVENYN